MRAARKAPARPRRTTRRGVAGGPGSRAPGHSRACVWRWAAAGRRPSSPATFACRSWRLRAQPADSDLLWANCAMTCRCSRVARSPSSLIAGLHALMIYGFASGLAQQVVASLPAADSGRVLTVEPAPQPPPPAATALRFRPDHIDGPGSPLDPPRYRLATEAGPAVTSTPLVSDAGPGATVAPGATRCAWAARARVSRTRDDYYPAASRRMSETGAATVQVCVDTQGRLTGDPTLATSSGSRRIDAGALNLARAGSGHYRPSTEDGRAGEFLLPLPDQVRAELTRARSGSARQAIATFSASTQSKGQPSSCS